MTKLLTEEQVLKIFNDDRKYNKIIEEYGISPFNLSKIKTGKTWGWLRSEEHTSELQSH